MDLNIYYISTSSFFFHYRIIRKYKLSFFVLIIFYHYIKTTLINLLKRIFPIVQFYFIGKISGGSNDWS